MKQLITALLLCVLLFCISACSAASPDNGQNVSALPETAESTAPPQTGGVNPAPEVGELACQVQYIRTNGYRDGVRYPQVYYIRSAQQLSDYYKANKDIFDLEHKDRVYSDTTIGFLDACERYDKSYFEEKYLVFLLLEEGSGSVRHKVKKVELVEGNQIEISVDRLIPEVGTEDMALWHIMVELDRETESRNVRIIIDGELARMAADHAHRIPEKTQCAESPVSGYCGNTQTTLYIGDASYTFMYGNSVTLTDMLIRLDYRQNKVCRCMAEYRIDTEFECGYEINLTQGFARCEKGQADLTKEQIDVIARIIEWAEKTDGRYQ